MMRWTFVLLAFSVCASASPLPRRSFLATAFRAARYGAPAPAPAIAPAPPPPPPPPPQPLPPKFPVISGEECALLQEGFLVDPPATCNHVVLAANLDGCSCTMTLPGNINPLPANFYNPFLVDIPPDPNIPVPQSMPTVPPPSNPMQPFVPPMMPPVCPFMNACADPDDFECVGHNSWGFASAHIADYSPAAAALNSASCTYMMKPYARFKVPNKVASLWHLNAKLIKVFDTMSEPFTVFCDARNETSASLTDFCKDQLKRLGVPCDTSWVNTTAKMAKECVHAPAPDGFELDSTMAELCPLECGWKKAAIRWPPHLTAIEKKEVREKKEKEDALKAKIDKDRKGGDEEEAEEKEEE